MPHQLSPGELERVYSDLYSFVGDGVLDRAIMRCEIQPEKFAGGLDDRFLAALRFFNTETRLQAFLVAISIVNKGAKEVAEDHLRQMREAGASDSRRNAQTPRAPSDNRPSKFLHSFDRQDVETAAALGLAKIDAPPFIICLVMVARTEDEPAYVKTLLSKIVAESSSEKSGCTHFEHFDLPRKSNADASYSLRYAILKALDPGASPVQLAKAANAVLARISQPSENRLAAVDIVSGDPDRDFRVRLLCDFLKSLSNEPQIVTPKVPVVVLVALFRDKLECRAHEAQIEALKNATGHFRGAAVIDLPPLDDCEHAHVTSWRDKLLGAGLEPNCLDEFSTSFIARLQADFPGPKKFSMQSVKISVKEIEKQYYG